jgi:hypothetical protein
MEYFFGLDSFTIPRCNAKVGLYFSTGAASTRLPNWLLINFKDSMLKIQHSRIFQMVLCILHKTLFSEKTLVEHSPSILHTPTFWIHVNKATAQKTSDSKPL